MCIDTFVHKFHVGGHTKSIMVGCSLAFSCTPKDVKVHADDNGTIVFLTNPTSFIGIIYHLKDTRSAYNSAPVLVLSIKHLNNVVNILPQ